ncbi:hypothetical protein LshimejAT787_1701830 [Lyophyllum shimeji]|uniref:PARP-type domain-containing protein n=1 Tax=Lyophyllum shimeji TaxID=47721 RepID=A0A9P3PZN0_LYOSH|nr:hypothetical protein LshimejAT787_1701830 [Lyophyllum shimeji]
MHSTGFRIEYATNVAQCQGPRPCNRTDISTGDLRIGHLIGNQRRRFSWRHWGCVLPQHIEKLKKAGVKNASELGGYEDLRPEDKLRVDEAWQKGEIAEEDIREVHRKPPAPPPKSPKQPKFEPKEIIQETSSEEEKETSGDHDVPAREPMPTKAGTTEEKRRPNENRQEEEEEEEEPPPTCSQNYYDPGQLKGSPPRKTLLYIPRRLPSRVQAWSRERRARGFAQAAPAQSEKATNWDAMARDTSREEEDETSGDDHIPLGELMPDEAGATEQEEGLAAADDDDDEAEEPPRKRLKTDHDTIQREASPPAPFNLTDDESVKRESIPPPPRVPYTLKDLFSPPRRRTAMGKERARMSSGSSGSSEETDDYDSDENSSATCDDEKSTGPSEDENEAEITEDRGADSRTDNSDSESPGGSDEDSKEERGERRWSVSRARRGRRLARKSLRKYASSKSGFRVRQPLADSTSKSTSGIQKQSDESESERDAEDEEECEEKRGGDEEPPPQVSDSAGSASRDESQVHASQTVTDVDTASAAANVDRASSHGSRTGDDHLDLDDPLVPGAIVADAEPLDPNLTNDEYIDDLSAPPPPIQTLEAIAEVPTYHLDDITSAIIQRVVEVQAKLDKLQACSTNLLSRLGLGDYAPAASPDGDGESPTEYGEDKRRPGQKRKVNRTLAFPRKKPPSTRV